MEAHVTDDLLQSAFPDRLPRLKYASAERFSGTHHHAVMVLENRITPADIVKTPEIGASSSRYEEILYVWAWPAGRYPAALCVPISGTDHSSPA
jgi:hypothetical protein